MSNVGAEMRANTIIDLNEVSDVVDLRSGYMTKRRVVLREAEGRHE